MQSRQKQCFHSVFIDFHGQYIINIPLCSQVVFLSLSYATVYLIYMRFRNTYDAENDTFRVEFLLVPVIGLSFLENYAFTPLEVKKHSERNQYIWLQI